MERASLSTGGTALEEVKRISKVKHGRVVDGVCGGFAKYLGVDPLWVRIGWALAGLAGGIGILAYFFGMYLFPRAQGDTAPSEGGAVRSSGPLIAGIILFGVGLLMVLRAVGILRYGFWGAWDVAWAVLWPLTLIAGGVFFLYIYWRQGREGASGFRRLSRDRMLLGVCSGLGEHFKVDPNIVRFAFALLVVLTRGIGLIIYILIGVLTPEAKDEAQVT